MSLTTANASFLYNSCWYICYIQKYLLLLRFQRQDLYNESRGEILLLYFIYFTRPLEKMVVGIFILMYYHCNCIYNNHQCHNLEHNNYIN